MCTPCPWVHPSPQHEQHLDRFSCFCTAHRTVSLYFTAGRYLFLKIIPSHGGPGPLSNAWLPGLILFLNPNGISMGSALFAWLTIVTKFDHGLTQLLHADLQWLDMPERVEYKLCMMMRRCQDGTTPQYLAVHWSPVSETASRQHLRSAANHQLTVPPHRRTTYVGRAFAVAGPSTWNSLPKCLRDPSSSFAVFARLLKTFLFSEY